MSHDLVIRNGTVVDGSGADPFCGDIAVDGAAIIRIGKVSGKGGEEIDATNLVVRPGFIDLHTHLDAQVFWKPELDPSSWHGITTVLMGTAVFRLHPANPRTGTFSHW
ncbi:MAG: amidohydrolase family protein [Proteobacteria bacterium]|jgi:N-acyl-D-amino-acid deacylase|nr:amidohydrolase family protein [Pseudomonadota bacterium]MBT6350375.1 amidohydrolase family protein [Pseudomonadota bacterium]